MSRPHSPNLTTFFPNREERLAIESGYRIPTLKDAMDRTVLQRILGMTVPLVYQRYADSKPRISPTPTGDFDRLRVYTADIEVPLDAFWSVGVRVGFNAELPVLRPVADSRYLQAIGVRIVPVEHPERDDYTLPQEFRDGGFAVEHRFTKQELGFGTSETNPLRAIWKPVTDTAPAGESAQLIEILYDRLQSGKSPATPTA